MAEIICIITCLIYVSSKLLFLGSALTVNEKDFPAPGKHFLGMYRIWNGLRLCSLWLLCLDFCCSQHWVAVNFNSTGRSVCELMQKRQKKAKLHHLSCSLWGMIGREGNTKSNRLPWCLICQRRCPICFVWECLNSSSSWAWKAPQHRLSRSLIILFC